MRTNFQQLNFMLMISIVYSIAFTTQLNTDQEACAKTLQEPELRQVYNNALQDGDLSSIMWILREDLKQPAERRIFSEVINLCDIKVAGSNTLFCQTNKGITRIGMPQLSGQPMVGSPADILLHGKDLSELKTNNQFIREIVTQNHDADPKKLKLPLPVNTSGEVDAAEYFKAYLIKLGKKITPKKITAAKLQATQSELVTEKVNQMWWALEMGPCNKFYNGIVAPIFVSQDNYVLDGHHRWAAVVANAFGTININNAMMDVLQVNEVIGNAQSGLVKIANDFANDFGIAAKAGQSQRP
jgi:hypothetical protein